MAKLFRTLREKMSPEAQRRAAEKAEAMIRDMPLDELRAARELTQEQLAKLLGVEQAAVSKMERRTELYVGTLRKFIEAMNGELVLAARFSDGVEVPIEVRIDGRVPGAVIDTIDDPGQLVPDLAE